MSLSRFVQFAQKHKNLYLEDYKYYIRIHITHISHFLTEAKNSILCLCPEVNGIPKTLDNNKYNER